MEGQQHKFIHHHFKTLVEKVDIDLMIPYLYCQDVLTSYDVELLNFPGWDCRRMKAIDLCHLVARRGTFAFSKFMIGLSIFQPDFFKELCDDNGTTMGPWIRELERFYLEELEKEKQKALLEGVDNENDMEVNSQNTPDSEVENVEPSADMSVGNAQPEDIDTPDVPDTSTGHLVQINVVELSPPSSPPNMEDRGLISLDSGAEENRTAQQPSLFPVTIEDKGFIPLNIVAEENEGDHEPSHTIDPIIEGNEGNQESSHAIRPIIQGGQGLSKSKTKHYDIGPDQIRTKSEPKDGDDETQLRPRTVFPLSLRKYALPIQRSDGTKFLHLKTVRTSSSKRRKMISLTLDQWKRLVETMEITLQVQTLVTRNHKDISVCVHLGEGVFMLVCPTYGNIEIRKYVGRGAKYLALPTEEGILLSPREWRRLVSYRRKIQNILSEEEGYKEDNEQDCTDEGYSQCYLAGRHQTFIGPHKCPDCGFQIRRESSIPNVMDTAV